MIPGAKRFPGNAIKSRTMIRLANNCVQATPDCACCEFLRRGSGAPDAERWVASQAHEEV